MKTIKLIILLLICIFSFNACSKKASKEEVISFYTKITEYITGDEFKNVLIKQKNEKESEIAVEKKMLEIAQSLNFKTLEEMKTNESVMQTQEVKDAIKKFEEAQAKAIYSVAEAKNAEEIKKAEGEHKDSAKKEEKVEEKKEEKKEEVKH